MLILSLFLAMHTGASEPTLRTLPILPSGLSADGGTVVGCTLQKEWLPCKWSPASGVGLLTLPRGWKTGYAETSSNNGAIVAGILTRYGKPPDVTRMAVIWSNGTTPRIITRVSSLNPRIAMSSDGILVGQYNGAFMWSRSTGVQKLPPLKSKFASCEAQAISKNGEVVVGVSDLGLRNPKGGVSPIFGSLSLQFDRVAEACIWRSGKTTFGLGMPEGYFKTEATGVSDDGRVVCGNGRRNGESYKALKWTDSAGFVELPRPDADELWQAHGISGDGLTIYGTALHFPGSNAVIWRKKLGSILLQDYFESLGLWIPAGWRISSVVGVSYNAMTWVVEAEDIKEDSRFWYIVL